MTSFAQFEANLLEIQAEILGERLGLSVEGCTASQLTGAAAHQRHRRAHINNNVRGDFAIAPPWPSGAGP
jgi:hypothetical protein